MGLFSRIFIPFAGILLVAVFAAMWVALHAMHGFHLDQTALALDTRARMAERSLSVYFAAGDPAAAEQACREMSRLADMRLTLILPSGQVLADSQEDASQMDNHSDRPEIREALHGQTGRAIRFSHTVGCDFFYVAIPVAGSEETIGVIRASVSLESVETLFQRVYVRIFAMSVSIALISAAMSWFVASRIGRPLRRMELGANDLANGNFDLRLPVPGARELASLAHALNVMASELKRRILKMEQQQNELDAVLSSMAEGVLAVDCDERLIRINGAAAALFGISAEAVRGRTIQEAIRNARLQECSRRVLSERCYFEEETTLSVGREERHLRISATPLRDTRGGGILGALLVLNDITTLRRLERARSEFVANVSHEIRTPVTSIKGYAETLLTEPRPDPATSEQFIEIISRQAERLCALVEDILSLAALERAEIARDVVLEQVDLCGAVAAAVEVCGPVAQAKGIQVVVEGGPGISVLGNGPLLEQAVINLLDNAVKYSEPGSQIAVCVAQSGDEASITVQDFGQGIAPEHFSRLFERFYRVDKGRSRKLGGTGLGLSIVKHILLIHGGSISVVSEPGKGSSFTICLPIRHSPAVSADDC